MTWWYTAVVWAAAIRAVYWVGHRRGQRAMYEELCRQFNLSPEELKAERDRERRETALSQLAGICEAIAHSHMKSRRRR